VEEAHKLARRAMREARQESLGEGMVRDSRCTFCYRSFPQLVTAKPMRLCPTCFAASLRVKCGRCQEPVQLEAEQRNRWLGLCFKCTPAANRGYGPWGKESGK
jgi:hypothetical protein